MIDIGSMAERIWKSNRNKGYVTEKCLAAKMKGLGLDDPKARADLMDAVESMGLEIRDTCEDGTGSDYDDEDLDMNSVRLYMLDVGRYGLLSRSEEYELAVRAKNGDREAREKMINSNLRLVISIAKRYIHSSCIELQDLMQAGNLGLIKAVDKFDPDVGSKFSTYATWWIKQAVTRYISDNCGTIRIPVYLCDAQKDIIRFVSQYQRKYGKEPSDKVLADEFGFREDVIAAYRKVKKGIDSIDAFASDEFDSDVGSYIADPSVSIEGAAVNSSISEAINAVLDESLTEREADIIRMRWGCDGTQEGKTLEEIGRKYSLTRERVRQIEKKAMTSLRNSPSAYMRLHPWLD